MSSNVQSCVYCAKECKGSDSKPYPNSKSRERIHNRCYIKKSLADKNAKSAGPSKCESGKVVNHSRPAVDLSAPSLDLMQRFREDDERLKASAQALKLNEIITSRDRQAEKNRDKSSFFFDIKAGIAKPHEKKKFLSHRKICEMAPRYDDHGFQQEAVGRSYDHTGKNLSALSDESGSDVEGQTDEPVDSRSTKRKSSDDRKLEKRPANKIDLSEKSCWFCLSSPDVEKHLIVSVGTYCYLTLAKGGLMDEHLLLIPIEHISSVTAKQNSKEVLAEKELFIERITDYFRSKSQGVVFFERNFRSVHWQIQAVPVPMQLSRGLDKKIKEGSAMHYNKSNYMDFSASLQITDIVKPGDPYLHWRIEPGGSNFATVIDVKGSYFPVQLPRMVLAQIMDCLDRVDWKKCCKTREAYLKLVSRIKDDWKKFAIDN